MRAYAEIKAEIAEFESKANAVHSSEIVSAKARVAEIMKPYGLSANDFDSVAKPQGIKRRDPVQAKYSDSVTGKTWDWPRSRTVMARGQKQKRLLD